MLIVGLGMLLPLPSAGHEPEAGRTEARAGDVSLCDLIEEALLADLPKPTPAVEFQEREERRAKIEDVKRKVQRLREQGRCS
ncbi:MAG: hypothetical protein R3349_04565 [Geminicoccaceae bacterium]|nr:hypothetical protein [Geminicoccaceae bacterium]